MNKMKKHHILFLGLLLAFTCCMPVMAQDDDDEELVYADGVQPENVVKKKAPAKPQYNFELMEVKGVVLDAVNKAPLPGVQVQTLNDYRFTAMSDEKGEFTIKVPVFATALYFHTTQYLSQHVAIGKNDGLRVEMIANKFRDMYENGTDILADNKIALQSTTSQTVETDIENLMGADVHAITRSGGPGYGAAMFIRGLNTLNANAQPLIVIDGIIRDMQQTRTGLHDGDYNNLMLNLMPEDIDNVQVLKNGTALYGASGGNGVILITTKRGRSMATRIDANIGVGVSLEPRLPVMMNAGQYRLYASEMLGTYPDINSYTNLKLNFLNDDPTNYYYNMYHNETDWTRETYRTALHQDYSINVQGGDNVGMYNLSLGYTDGQSNAQRNGFNRLSVRFNTDISILERLKTRFDMSFTKINRNVFDDGAPADFSQRPVSSPTFLSLIKSPFLNPYTFYASGQLSNTLSEADTYLTELHRGLSLGNPTALLENGEAINKNRVENTEFYAVIAPRYEFNKHLSISETFNYTLNRVSQRYFRPKGGMPKFLNEGVGYVENLKMSMFSKETSVMSDTRIQYKNQFGAHYLDIYGGMRFSSFSFDDNQPQAQDDTGSNDMSPNVSAGAKYKTAVGVSDSWKSITWYANADYNYRNLYFLQASLAMESSSRFGKNADALKLAGVRWGLFPSVQAGWAMTNEKWFPKTKAINYFLLKAGFDVSGNDDINNYAAMTSFMSYKYLNNATAAQLTNIGNDKIRWEQTNKFNVGFKSYWLNNRLGLDFDYFIHHTKDLLTLKSFDNPVAGINNYWSNGGSLQNTGFELKLTTKPVVSKNFNMELGASIGHYVNKIKSLPNEEYIYIDGVKNAQGYTSSIYGTDNIATVVDHAAGLFYGYKTQGVFANDADALKAGKDGYLYLVDRTGAPQYFKSGDVHFVDLNGDGIISEADKTIIGDPNPDIYGNIFANMVWKNFTLFVGFNYSLGNDVFNYQRSILEGGKNFYNQTIAITNRWRYEGQQTDIPRLAYDDPMGNSRFSDRWIEDGSYLRLKTIRLTYKVPVNFSWLQGLSLWAEATNVFTVTRYLGSDPEFSVANGVLYQGIDAGYMAQSRAFTFGLKINL